MKYLEVKPPVKSAVFLRNVDASCDRGGACNEQEVEETWNLELKSFLDQGNVDGGHDAGPSVENQGASWGEARKVPAKRRGASDEEYWHR